MFYDKDKKLFFIDKDSVGDNYHEISNNYISEIENLNNFLTGVSDISFYGDNGLAPINLTLDPVCCDFVFKDNAIIIYFKQDLCPSYFRNSEYFVEILFIDDKIGLRCRTPNDYHYKNIYFKFEAIKNLEFKIKSLELRVGFLKFNKG